MSEQPTLDQEIAGTPDSQFTELDGVSIPDSPAELTPEEPEEYHTILEVWKAILSPARESAHDKVTPQWAARMCSKFSQLRYSDMNHFRDRYYALLAELEDTLDAVIAADDECLKVLDATEDAQHNGPHYAQILTDWQILLLGRELDWDCTDEHAAVDLAVVSEIHSILFGPTGMTALLDGIPFEYTDMHHEALALALQEFRESREAKGE